MYKEYFVYSASFLPLASGTVGSNNPFTDVEVRIDPDSDFEFSKTTHVATANAFRLKYRDDSTGRNLMKASQDARAISGTTLNFSGFLANVVAVSLSPAIVGANTTSEQTFTVTGAAVGQFVYVNKPTAQTGLGIVGARVSAANTVAINFGNFTGGGITPTASETYTFILIGTATTNPVVATNTLVNGYAGNFIPFVWPRAYIIAGATTFTVSAADNSGASNTIRIAFHGSKLRPGTAPWDRKYRAMIPYVYPINTTGTVPGVAVIATASDTISAQIPTDKDGAFLCMKISGQLSGDALVTIKDGARDRQWMDAAVHSRNLVGNSTFPNILPSPRFIQKGAVISTTVQDTSAVANNSVEINYVGVKVYE